MMRAITLLFLVVLTGGCNSGQSDKTEVTSSEATAIGKRLDEYQASLQKAATARLQAEQLESLKRYLHELKMLHFSTESGPNLGWYFRVIDVNTQENVTMGPWAEKGRSLEVKISVGVYRDGRYEILRVITFRPLDNAMLSRLYME